ncbi:MAG: DMT family transporter [Candidatus Atribacteria bacterium]|nr:MAG: DMT family transporter [Candidatus Atribacteria bacterium]
MRFGILAAVLFGMSAPLSKLLLEGVDPIILAGLLYLGAGGALGLLLLIRKALGQADHEAALEGQDLPWLLGAILTGGVAGPILLLLGLQRTPAATASLLLNFEVVATGLLAFMLFRESVGRRTWGAILAVALGGVLLTLDPSGGWGISLGAILVLGACLAWGFDNNFTGRISLKDPKRIVAIKGIAAGTCSLILGLALSRPLPSLGRALWALGLGIVSYGASIALFVQSLRQVGAARTGALFGMAPFVGVALSLVLFRQLPEWRFFLALPLMVLAAILLAREEHEHPHIHTGVRHTHSHRHDDDHHDHAHGGGDGHPSHVHEHAHQDLSHSHAHLPDPHHRHGHKDASH